MWWIDTEKLQKINWKTLKYYYWYNQGSPWISWLFVTMSLLWWNLNVDKYSFHLLDFRKCNENVKNIMTALPCNSWPIHLFIHVSNLKILFPFLFFFCLRVHKAYSFIYHTMWKWQVKSQNWTTHRPIHWKRNCIPTSTQK